MPWTWIEGEITMLVEDLGIWLNTIGTGEEETELEKAEDWNMNKDGG